MNRPALATLAFLLGACANDEALQIQDVGGTTLAALPARDRFELVLKLDPALELGFWRTNPERRVAEPQDLCPKTRAMGGSIDDIPEDSRLVFQHPDGQVSVVGPLCHAYVELRRPH